MARRAVKRAGSLERQQPERIRGRQLYLQELMQHSRGLAETWTQEQAQAVMQAHGRQYALLTDADRQHYELRARALSAQRRAVLEEELVSLEATVLTSRAQWARRALADYLLVASLLSPLLSSWTKSWPLPGR